MLLLCESSLTTSSHPPSSYLTCRAPCEQHGAFLARGAQALSHAGVWVLLDELPARVRLWEGHGVWWIFCSAKGQRRRSPFGWWVVVLFSFLSAREAAPGSDSQVPSPLP